MSPKMPAISAKVMIAFLESSGFCMIRQRGSHKFFRHSDGRTATVPDHDSEDLGRGIISKIIRDAEISRDHFIKWYFKK